MHPLDLCVELGELLIGDALRSELRGEALQRLTHLTGVLRVLRGDLDDEVTASRHVREQALTGQPLDRLTHRRLAHAEPPRDLGFDHAVVRREIALDDGLAQQVVHLVRDQGLAEPVLVGGQCGDEPTGRIRCHEFPILHWGTSVAT